MRVTGIVAEYNPFHKGHAYHIAKAREETEAEGIAVVMSGSFVQRGEPAVFDKWTRAYHALAGGADLVIELPALYSLSSAEHFAKGAVRILRSTGIVNTISFGSECGDLEKLTRTAHILESEPPLFQSVLKTKLRDGCSYAAARAAALAAENPELGDILQLPNNILAVAYLREIGNVHAHTVTRMGGGYLETEVGAGFASAMALRKMLYCGKDVEIYTGYSTQNLYPQKMEQYEIMILYACRTAEWDRYVSVPENVKKRLQKAKIDCLDTLLESAKTKHITMAAIKRALMQILLKNNLDSTCFPPYIRILGFTETGEKMLKQMKTSAGLPVITRTAAFKEDCPVWELEKRATDIYDLPQHLTGQDLKRPPVRYRREEK